MPFIPSNKGYNAQPGGEPKPDGNLPDKSGPSELEQRLMQIKTSNRNLRDALQVAEMMKQNLDDPTVVTVEGDNADEQEICIRIGKAEYFHLCELLGLPTDSTPQDRLQMELDEVLEDEPDEPDLGIDPEIDDDLST